MMNRFLESDFSADDHPALSPPRPMSPAELGDTVARLVWESFSDFLLAHELAELAERRGVAPTEGILPQYEAEEILIFHLWAHTQGIQLAFFRRVPEEILRAGLDALHRAVFEDMVENGTPRRQLPVFEQRVSARYSEYHAAAGTSDEAVGRQVLSHLGKGTATERDARFLAARAVELTHPLRDFLDDVELIAD